MCGISGFVTNENKDLIHESIAKIAHRGPDGSGIFIDEYIALGHRRLAIQDLTENGKQPMFTADGQYCIIYNGEIYNHWEIRETIKNKYPFISTSDTETILYGYIEYGDKIFNMLNGIFALAIYNTQTFDCILVRDQFGVKPLYYYQKGNYLAFSSEIKALKVIPDFDETLNNESLISYIHFLYSPGNNTPFKYVKKLLPGHLLKFNAVELINSKGKSTIKIKKYYEIPFNGKYFDKSEEELIDELDTLLFNAVKRQLISDVPIGFFLSGGLDSSAVVAMAKKAMPQKKLKCFTIDYGDINDEGFTNDLAYAKQVAEHLDVELEIVDGKVDIIRDFDKMIYHLDEPQADTAPLHVLNISKIARKQGYTVLLGGAAGDDLFSGYRRHQALIFEKYFEQIPLPIRKFLNRISKNSLFKSNSSFIRRIKKVLSNIQKSKLERMAGYFGWVNIDINKNLFKDSFRKSIESYNPENILINSLENIPNEKSELNQMLFWELKYFLVDHNLNYTDKLSMAEGVEVRVPFLDKDLVEFSTKIPPNLKLKNNVTKYLLKKVMERYLPKEVIYRSKSGFGTPIREWSRNELKEYINENLNSKTLDQAKIFNVKTVHKLISDNLKGKIDGTYTILSLISIVSWLKLFTKQQIEPLRYLENVNLGNYQICTNCVMDTSDSKISFDSLGVCDHCHDYMENVLPNWHTDEKGRRALDKIVKKIKEDGKNRDFDCIMGMSGGGDSSFMLHLAVKELGLRPLVFHVDGGWNSELAVNNINVMIDKLRLDLYTEVINWQEMQDFQLAFFKSGVPHIDLPQDHAFIATLYNFADKYKIKYILNGGNYSTECVRNPLEWLYYGTDMAQINDIISRFSTIPMKTYPFSSILRHKVYLRYIRKIQMIKPLNYMPYIKSDAMDFLNKTYGWMPYPQKHFESRFTKFYEGYWLPNKFGYDTRRVQYSSLILTNQMSRDEALQKLSLPAIDEAEAKHDFEYVATKLGITVSELQFYFDSANMTYKNYNNYENMFNFGAKTMKMLGIENSIKR